MTLRTPRAVRALALVGSVAAVVLTLTSTPATAGADVVRFDRLHSVHDLRTAHRYLHGTSRAFQHFAAREGAAVRRADAGCQEDSGVYVEAFTRGYAYGGVGACGGYEALWTNHLRGGAPGGHWREVFGSQDGWYCPALKRYQVPSALVGTSCYSPSRGTVIAYHQA